MSPSETQRGRTILGRSLNSPLMHRFPMSSQSLPYQRYSPPTLTTWLLLWMTFGPHRELVHSASIHSRKRTGQHILLWPSSWLRYVICSLGSLHHRHLQMLRIFFCFCLFSFLFLLLIFWLFSWDLVVGTFFVETDRIWIIYLLLVSTI